MDIVLIAGLWLDGSAWDDVLPELERLGHRGVPVTLPGQGDGAGSVEALEDALSKIEVGDEVSLRVIDRGVGAITETNVSLAAASKAVIIGFNVRPTPHAAQMADRENVDLRF